MGRIRIAPAAALVVALVMAGCGDGQGAIVPSPDPRADGRSGFDATSSAPGPTPSGQVDDAASDSAPTTTAPTGPTSPKDALTAALDAYDDVLDPTTTRVLQFTLHTPCDGRPYASVQSQDPAAPTHVDERDWRDGVVGEPSPVVLTGGGDLDSTLFTFGEIGWDAIWTALDSSVSLVEQEVGPLENSDGITHLIVSRNLPFSPDVVIRVYVDGGDRSLGGYVRYLADGRVDAVQA